MLKRLFILLFIAFYTVGKSQCPQIYDGLGNLSSNAQFINCIAGNYAINFQSNSSFSTYTIDWGDGTPVTTGTSYTANTTVPHTYTNTIGTFTMTYTIGSPACTQTALVVMERPVSASIQIPIGGVTQVCAPKTLTFTNSSTNVSSTTTFTWDFGDGSAPVAFNSTNVGQNVTHTYLKGTVNCQTQVTLKALNYCRFNSPSVANYNPIQIYDIDDAQITPDKAIRCLPDNQFTFTNTTNRNCVPEGNTFQRQEKWDLGNYFGTGHDSIINWRPWPPTAPITIAFPLVVGSYTVLLLDSNFCGIDTKILSVSIVNPPTAGVITPTANRCANTALTFTNSSSVGYSYLWNFGDGGGYNNIGAGNKVHSYASPGTYTVSLVAMLAGAGGACSDTARVAITILGSPTSSFAFSPTNGCNSLSGVTFTNLSIGGSTYNWNFGNGQSSSLITPPAQNYTTTGVFTVSLVVTGTTSCVNTKTASVLVSPKPIPNFPIISPCVAAAGTFSSTSIVTGTSAINSFSWDFGDGSASSTSSNTSHTYTAPATYTVKLVVATAFCTDSISKNVVVNVRPTANFAFTPTVNCPPFTASFTNTSISATNYLWRFGTAASATSTAANPSNIYTNSTQNFQNYTVTLIASTGLGCADSLKLPLTVNPKPVAIFNISTSGGCSPLAITFTNNSLGAASSDWDFGDGVTSTSVNPVHTFTNTTFLLNTSTITLIATNSISCSDTVKHSLQVFPQPLTSFAMNPGSGCTPLTVTFPSVPGIVSYTWSFGDGTPLIVASSATTHVYTNTTTANQSYTVRLIASNAFGCVDSSFKFPLIYPTPIPNYIMSPTVGCSPMNSILSNLSLLASNYLWRFGDGATSTLANVSHTYINTTNIIDQTFTCTLFAYTSNGCQDSLKKNVLVHYKPLSSFQWTNPQCLSQTINFTDNTTGSTSGSWLFGDNTAALTATNPSHTYTNNTNNNINYTVQLVSTTPSSCQDTALGYPVIFAHPVPNFASFPAIGCSPINNTLTNVSVNSQSYLWEFGDGTPTSTVANMVHTYSNTTHTNDQTFTCTLVGTNANGCKDSVKKVITVYYKPLASFLVNAPGCVSTIINFTNTSSPATPIWNFGDATTSTLTSPSHTYANFSPTNSTYTVQLIVTTPNSCRDTTYGTAVIFAHPIANFAITPTVGCSPLSNTVTNNSTLANTYKWKFGDGATATTTNSTHTYHNASFTTDQTYSCTLIAINNNGCKDSLKQEVLVLHKPNAVFSSNDPKCLSQTITFSNTSAGSSINAWTFGDNTPSSTAINPIHTYTNTTLNNFSYNIQLVVTTPSLCTDTAYENIQIYAHPVALFALTPSLGCSPMLTSMTNSSSASHTYKWKFGDGQTATTPLANHTYTNPSHTSDQTFTCTLVAYNNNGCRDSLDVPLMVYFRPKSIVALDTPACTPKLITFTNTSIGSITYNWNFGDGNTSIASDPVHEFINNTPFNQTFSITLISSSPNNCKDSLFIPTVIHPKPHFFISAQPDSGCSPLDVYFPTIGGVSSYLWYYDEIVGFGSTGNIHNAFVNKTAVTKTIHVKLIARDIYTCADTATTLIKVFPQPDAEFSAQPLKVYIPNEATQMYNHTSGATSYSWAFGDGGTSNDIEPTHTYTATGEFQIVLIASNDAGCKDTSTLKDVVMALGESTVLMPNAFTPSSSGSPGTTYSDDTDQHNSVFHPFIKGADKYELSIYSRWGELLFLTKNAQEGWDGYYKGQICTQDVYIWKVVATFVDGKVYRKTGDLLLLR